jgi:hypothetical protein
VHYVRKQSGASQRASFFSISRVPIPAGFYIILIMKEAVLDFARRHRLPPPSWWAEGQVIFFKIDYYDPTLTCHSNDRLIQMSHIA